jgi:magnesium transporter
MRSFINLEKNKEGFDINKFMDILEHCDRVHRQTTTQLSRLEYLYNFYTSKNTERMNKLMSILTLVSVIFLPLNLIVGYFGMNTSGLPLTVSTTMGSTIVAWLLLSTSAFVGIITYFVLRLFQK